MSRPIREMAKLNERLRFLQARRKRDLRFADLVAQMTTLSEEFISTASMIEDAASVVAYGIRKRDYAMKQSLIDDDEDEDDPFADFDLDGDDE